MSAAVPGPREPKPCPRCGETCTHDGWGHVHPNGIGIGSCTVPDPRFRDQLLYALRTAPDIPVLWPSSDKIVAALMPVIAAEVEARVQAAANQRAAEELRKYDVPGLAKSYAAQALYDAAAAWPDAYASSVSDWLEDRAAALASPAPAPRAEEGQ